MAQVEKEKKRRLFADVSAVQVVATALAAVTSMLLSSYIGIAGSVIGVAVASIVSTLAASLYKKFLADSAEKIKELPVIAKPGETLGQIIPGRHAEGAADANSQGAPTSAGAGSPDDADGARAAHTLAASTAEVTASGAVDQGEERPSAQEAEPADGLEPREGAEPEPDAVAALRKQRRLVRGLIVVCVVSALLAVAASAAVVYFATMGAGLGTKTTPIYLTAPVDQADEAASQSANAASGSAASAEDDAAESSSSSSSSASDSSAGSEEPGGGTGGDEGAGNTTEPADPSGDGGSGDTAPDSPTDGSGKPAPGAKPAT